MAIRVKTILDARHGMIEAAQSYANETAFGVTIEIDSGDGVEEIDVRPMPMIQELVREVRQLRRENDSLTKAIRELHVGMEPTPLRRSL